MIEGVQVVAQERAAKVPHALASFFGPEHPKILNRFATRVLTAQLDHARANREFYPAHCGQNTPRLSPVDGLAGHVHRIKWF